MREILIVILLSASVGLSAATITDMAGRVVTIPDKIERVLPYDAKISILLFPVAAEMMVGKALVQGSEKYRFIADAYGQLPEVDVKNVEEVLANSPQVIIAGAYSNSDNYDRVEKMQKRTQIPVVVVDLSLGQLDKTYQFLGELLGNKDKCLACATFLQSIYRDTEALMVKHPLTDVDIYYTLGLSGLLTDPSGSQHTEVIDYLKLDNVAKVPIPTGGHASVNMEQVMIWDPDYILCAGFKGDKNAYATITRGSKWANISAVKNNRVYKVPSQPFGWFDHPPTVNRIPGIIWLSEVFYQLPPVLAQARIRAFYKLFFQYELTAEEYKMLFQ
jgi:iron complex transport system substrate-binding protein